MPVPGQRLGEVVVVVPNWNGASMLGAALGSLAAQTRRAHVVVVDNGSHDGSVALVEREHPDVELVRLPTNTGFAGGMNAGIAVALERGADAVAAFNNDAVAEPAWLELLVGDLERFPEAGIATGKVLRTGGTLLDTTGEFYATCGQPFARGRNEPDTGRYDVPEEVFAASGCATLYRTAMLREVGVFDPRFFAYYEDVDLSWRARLAGWSVRYQPAARVEHRVSATSGRLGSFTRLHASKNFLLLYVRDMPGRLFWRHLPPYAVELLLQLAYAVLHRDAAWFRGVAQVLRAAPEVLRERRRIQSARRVPVEQVDRWLHRGAPPAVPPLPAAG